MIKIANGSWVDPYSVKTIRQSLSQITITQEVGREVVTLTVNCENPKLAAFDANRIAESVSKVTR